MTRVRIAPSPTGMAHIGTAYAALLNFAYAKKNNGVFVLRIEDTDQVRNVADGETAIYEGLKWLGISWDEGPYRQSERLEIYNKKIEELLKNKLAYEDDGAVRFKNPGEDITWKDLIKGEITFPGKEITDFVIRKSDGYPTYNFAVVVDDIDMKITHVIRGEDHVSNTPRQLALYKAFEINPPKFAHHPTLRNKDHKKLSKRRDPVDIRIFQEQGYLPEAIINFLGLLGWSHPEGKEEFSLDEFINKFTLERVRKSGPIFNLDKLDWLNSQYIKKMSDEKLCKLLFKFFGDKYSKNMLKQTTSLVQERIKKLSEYETLAGFFYKAPKVDKKLLDKNYINHLKSAREALSEINNWDLGSIGKSLMKAVEENNYHTGKFFMDLRIVMTGQKVTPPINESMYVLGKMETIDRIKKI